MNVNDLAHWEHTATFLSVDLGKLQDFTAISVINRYEWFAVPCNPRDPFIPSLRPVGTGRTRYEIPFLQRLPLNTDYVKQVEIIQGIFATLQKKCAPFPHLVIDGTGAGGPVADMLREQGLNPIEVWFSGGNTPTRRTWGWNVPKSDIISALQRAIGRGELKIAAKIPEAATLLEEATRMEAIQNPVSGYVKYSHREGEHDDLLLSVGIGLWLAYWYQTHRLRSMPLSRLGL